MSGPYDYYLHRDRGFKHFANVGKPFKVYAITYYIMKALGYKATKVCEGASIDIVLLQATLNRGAHPKSFAFEELLIEFCPDELTTYFP